MTALETEGVRQEALADRIGISGAEFSRWKTGSRDIPIGMLPRLAEAIRVEQPILEELASDFPIISAPDPRRILLPPYPIKGSINDLPKWFVEKLDLTKAQWHEIEHGFPRDTARELAVALQVLRHGGELCWCAPVDLGCGLLIIKRETFEAAGHLLRHAVRMVGKAREVIVIPQVSTAVVSQSREARLDYLVRWKGPRVCVWADLEVDSTYHEETADDDRRRTHGLRLRRLGFSDSQVVLDSFMPRLIDALRKLEADVKKQG
jgi:transcriptional regulator with XRE-family HTH domain